MIKTNLIDLSEKVECETRGYYSEIEKTALKNLAKVLQAFQKARISDFHLRGATGYGYGDMGREALESVYAEIFRAEAALVRTQIVSGTHAIALCLYGVLRPGDELLAVQGSPYDTLSEMIGIRGRTSGSLKEFGITYKQVDLTREGDLDFKKIGQAVCQNTRMVMLQRSRGYRWVKSLGISDIREIITYIKKIKKGVVIFVDNCYGEFVEEEEPVEVGADLVAGSLIKNPGGGLAPTGGYVAGRSKYVKLAAQRWSAPGIGSEVGPSGDNQRLLFQGLFLAPHIVSEALKGAVFAARFFERMGFDVLPKYNEKRSDLVQAIKMGTAEKIVAFCRGLQAASPIDSHVKPEAGIIPGYGDQVVMAAGTFVQGASLELSADGPLRPPYAVYLQGGLCKEHVKLAVISAAREVLKL